MLPILLKTVIVGLALASCWFWVYTITTKTCDRRLIKFWLKVIVLQGFVMSYALIMLGIV